jgi:hypothetical protein
VCSSHVTTRNSNFQQLAKDKKLNPNQWEVHLIEFKICEDTRPDPQLQKAKAQHSMLMANLNRQGYLETKLHVILVGAMGTIYKDYTDKPLADLKLDYHKKIENLTHKLNEHSIRHASALIKTRYALQYNTSNRSQGLGLGAMAQGGVTATAPSRDLTDNKKKRREGSSRGESKRHTTPLTHTNFFLTVCEVGGCLVRGPK